MKGILTKAGFEITHNVTMGKVYEFLNHPNGHMWFRNDEGQMQEFLFAPHEKYLEVPEGYHVVKALSAPHQDTYSWKEGDYLVVRDSKLSPNDQYELLHQEWPCMMKNNAELVMDSSGSCEITLPKYIVLEQSIDGLEVGMHYEVLSINISGSYLVSKGNGCNAIVAANKCHPWNGICGGETKVVKCRCAKFGHPPVFPRATAHPAVPPVAPSAPTSMDKPMKLNQQQQRPAPFVAQEISDDTRRTIKKQKSLTKELLAFAMIMDSQAFVTGGAPRNWHLGMAANDLDIMLRVPNGASEQHLIHIMEAFGFVDVFNKTTHSELGVKRPEPRYGRNLDNVKEEKRLQDQKIEVVLEGIYQGQQAQFIFLRPNTMMGLSYTRNHFDTSINMIIGWLDGDCELQISADTAFKESMNTGVIFVYENGSAYGNPDHLNRMHRYFPEAPMVPKEHRAVIVGNPSLAYKYAMEVEDFRPESSDDDDMF